MLKFSNNIVFCANIFCICITLTNSVDSDEMLNNAAFHLGLHCL